MRLVYKDLPILGPASVLAAKALLAAQRQGGYEKLRTALMQAPPDTTMDRSRQLAEPLGLDWPRLARDMDDPAIQQRLDANLTLAQALGIEGTPALVIGDELVPGAVEVADLEKAVADGAHGEELIDEKLGGRRARFRQAGIRRGAAASPAGRRRGPRRSG